MARIIFSYIGSKGHTQVVIDGQVVATDYDLTYSVALMHFITQDIKATGLCDKVFDPWGMFKFKLGTPYDVYQDDSAVINTYKYVLEEGLTDEYVKQMLKDVVEFCMCKFNIQHFEIIWRLDINEIYS